MWLKLLQLLFNPVLQLTQALTNLGSWKFQRTRSGSVRGRFVEISDLGQVHRRASRCLPGRCDFQGTVPVHKPLDFSCIRFYQQPVDRYGGADEWTRTDDIYTVNDVLALTAKNTKKLAGILRQLLTVNAESLQLINKLADSRAPNQAVCVADDGNLPSPFNGAS
jgi:hypothetical protein